MARQQQNYAGATHPYAPATPNLPQQPSQQLPYAAQQVQPALVAGVGGHPGAYGVASSPQNLNRPAQPAAQAAHFNGYQVNTGSTQRTAETYVLPEAANEAIPFEIRAQFPQDDQGRVLFFTQPPLDTEHSIVGNSKPESSHPLQHSDKHMRALAARKRKREEVGENTSANGLNNSSEIVSVTEQAKPTEVSASKEGHLREQVTARAMTMVTEQINKGMIDKYKAQEGENWNDSLSADLRRGEERLTTQREKDRQAATKRAAFNSAHLGKHQLRAGQYAVNAQGYITGWQKNLFTSIYLDDHDSRLP